MAASYRFTDYLSIDFEYAIPDSEFGDDRVVGGNQIIGALKDVFQAEVNLGLNESWFGSLRHRYLGERSLVEIGFQNSNGTATWNFRLGYKRPKWQASIDVLDISDSDDHDIDYFYESRLSNEPSGLGAEDVHFRPIEPRTLCVSVQYNW